jgi:hypothetical protein
MIAARNTKDDDIERLLDEAIVKLEKVDGRQIR